MQLMDSSQTWQAKQDTIDISQYIRILKRRKWSIILITFLSLVLGVYYLSKATPIYQASAKIQADPVQPNASAQDQYIMNSMVFLFYETQYEIIQSRKVAETVVDKLDLVNKYKVELEELKAEGGNKGLLDPLKTFIKGFIADEEEQSFR